MRDPCTRAHGKLVTPLQTTRRNYEELGMLGGILCALADGFLGQTGQIK